MYYRSYSENSNLDDNQNIDQDNSKNNFKYPTDYNLNKHYDNDKKSSIPCMQCPIYKHYQQIQCPMHTSKSSKCKIPNMMRQQITSDGYRQYRPYYDPYYYSPYYYYPPYPYYDYDISSFLAGVLLGELL